MNSQTGVQKENYTEIGEDTMVWYQLCVEEITSSDRVVYCAPDRKNEDTKLNPLDPKDSTSNMRYFPRISQKFPPTF